MPITNVNCGYAIVRGIVFPSVAEAEKYCRDHELDPKCWLHADSPTALAECKRAAHAALPILRYLLDLLARDMQRMDADIEAKLAARDRVYKESPLPIDAEGYQARLAEACNKALGYGEAERVVRNMVNELNRIGLRRL